MSLKDGNNPAGIQRLVRIIKEEFKQPENTRYYSDQDYAEAERKYVRFRLNNG